MYQVSLHSRLKGRMIIITHRSYWSPSSACYWIERRAACSRQGICLCRGLCGCSPVTNEQLPSGLLFKVGLLRGSPVMLRITGILRTAGRPGPLEDGPGRVKQLLFALLLCHRPRGLVMHDVGLVRWHVVQRSNITAPCTHTRSTPSMLDGVICVPGPDEVWLLPCERQARNPPGRKYRFSAHCTGSGSHFSRQSAAISYCHSAISYVTLLSFRHFLRCPVVLALPRSSWSSVEGRCAVTPMPQAQ